MVRTSDVSSVPIMDCLDRDCWQVAVDPSGWIGVEGRSLPFRATNSIARVHQREVKDEMRLTWDCAMAHSA